MAGTIHGKIESADPAADFGDIGSTMFKNVFDLLNSLTASGEVTRIAFNSGANAGSGNGEGFFNEPNHLGQNAFACYRFNTNSNRNFEWYLLMQFMTGSATFGDPPGDPGLLDGATPAGGADANNIGFACAVTISGSTSANPWNGSANNDGNDSKGNPVWNSASADHDLFIMPRSNNDDGTHSTSRENMMQFYAESSTNLPIRIHSVLDDQGLVVAVDTTKDGLYTINYMGAYDLRSDLTASIKAPLCAFMADGQGSTLFTSNNDAGSTNSTNTWEGGVVAKNGVRLMSVRRYGSDFLTSTTLQPNKQFAVPKNDTFPVAVVCTEVGEEGHLGFLPENIYKESYNLPSEAADDDLQQIHIGDTEIRTNANAIRIVLPWDGQTRPGSGLSRTGSLFSK